MREEMTACPVCKGEIPASVPTCPFCGALFAVGSAPGRMIQKGILCHHCGERTYSTEACTSCGQPIGVKCPACSSLIPLHANQCPECGEAIRKFGKYRKRLSRPSQRVPRAAGLAAGLILLAAAAAYAFLNPPQVVENTEIPNPRPIDSNYDGAFDTWEYRSESGALERSEIDGDGDGVPERWVYFDTGGNRSRLRIDEDHNGVFEQEKTFWPGGGVKEETRYAPGDQERPVHRKRYRQDGGVIDEALDSDGDERIDTHVSYTANGAKYEEGRDTNGDGILNEYRTFTPGGRPARIAVDADGNGVFEHEKALAGGKRTVWERFDEDQDGIWERKILYRASGVQRFVYLDTDADGLYDRTESYTKRGTLARTGFDTDKDERPNYWR